jgi:hypothetical protein
VRNRIEVAMLPDDLKEVLRGHGAESFTASHAMELRRIEDHVARQALTKTVIDQGYNYQQTKEAVEHELHPFAEPAYPSAAYEESSEEAARRESSFPPQKSSRGTRWRAGWRCSAKNLNNSWRWLSSLPQTSA